MQLERLAVRLRPRNPWEALDLGLALVRAKAGRVYGAWLVAYVPIAALLVAVLHEDPVYAWLILWWLKPLFDRLILALLSRDMFDENASLRSIVTSPRQWMLGTGLLAALTWRRFDLARSFHLPVRQLERAKGKAGRERVAILDRDARGAALWLTFLLFCMEVFLSVAGSLAVTLLLPVQVPLDSLLESWFASQTEDDTTSLLVGGLVAVVAVTIIEPVYVAAGFTLYLQRRTMLEGWDIELRFRQMTQRVAQAKAASTRPVAALLACAATALALLVASPGEALAADPPPAPAAVTSTPDAKAEIKKVLADPDFGKPDVSRRLKYVGPEWKRDKKEKKDGWDWSWLLEWARALAEGSRIIAWGAAALALIVALYHLARYLRIHYRPSTKAARPDFLFGLDVRPESLPDDVASAAATLAREGRAREALSLLYRGALVRFLDQGLEFLSGDTEGDCLRRVDAQGAPPARDYFRRLVSAWQTLAYGHRTVPSDTVVALAEDWRAQFATP